ncbi:MAG: hypothetical protein GX147_00765, partial [Deltaproteobacteria bacterium]|nr:hypothetical protein [Deltaproteobacteria bacterium]
PESLHSALETASLLSADNARFVTVLGGLRELGRYSFEAHENAAVELLNAGVDLVFLVGEETRTTHDYLKRNKQGAAMVAGWFETCEEVIPEVIARMEPGDFLLLKASRFYELEKIGEALKNIERAMGS